ncbi:hypothetical protein POTOM_019791 [Populus tomentosa]|uniref:Uncharacterized protein n=1 Tax=Populus tomentosa TaxID=118781 RepID=A0A8X8D3D6_POPTO|nr:hypothetical protein POTOM_019791 [Populus tomentosa]
MLLSDGINGETKIPYRFSAHVQDSQGTPIPRLRVGHDCSIRSLWSHNTRFICWHPRIHTHGVGPSSYWTSMQVVVYVDRILGFNKGASKGIRIYYGLIAFHANSHLERKRELILERKRELIELILEKEGADAGKKDGADAGRKESFHISRSFFNKAVVRSKVAGLEGWKLVDEDPIRIH